jgi:hypothetical protein
VDECYCALLDNTATMTTLARNQWLVLCVEFLMQQYNCVFYVWSVRRLCNENNTSSSVSTTHGGGFEYLHRNPDSRRRRQNGNPVPGGITGPGTWPSTLGESRIWGSKMWSLVPRDTNPRMTALARTSSSCKLQTCPLVRVRSPHQQTCNCQTVTTLWS